MSGQDGPAPLVAGVAVEVAPGVRRVLAPNPNMMTGPGTNTYLVGTTDVVVIDPGPDDDSHLAALLEAGGDRIRWIAITHTHIDHSPLTAALKVRTGAEALGFGPAPVLVKEGIDGHDRTFDPDRVLGDGDVLDGPDFRLRAVHTPGHAANHLCFELAGDGLLFSGDHVMQGSTVVISPPDGDMAIYLESLEKVRRLGLRRIAPGHGNIIEDPAAVLDGYLAHRVEREASIVAALAPARRDAPATVEQLVEAIYVDVPEALHPVARCSVWAHLRKLAAEGVASSADLDDMAAPWWTGPPVAPAGR